MDRSTPELQRAENVQPNEPSAVAGIGSRRESSPGVPDGRFAWNHFGGYWREGPIRNFHPGPDNPTPAFVKPLGMRTPFRFSLVKDLGAGFGSGLPVRRRLRRRPAAAAPVVAIVDAFFGLPRRHPVGRR